MNAREKAAIEKHEAEGYDVITNGFPDLILLKDGEISFLEVKSQEDYLSEKQERAIGLLRKHGYNVSVRWYGYITNELIEDKGEHTRKRVARNNHRSTSVDWRN